MTRDTPAPGVVVYQPATGFRYSVDAFWLAGFALEGGRPRDVLDLGTGAGVVAFLFAGIGIPSVGIDVNADWKPHWAASTRESTRSPELVVQDVLDCERRADVVVCNPPFYRQGSGPAPTDGFRRLARMESTATLGDFVACATRCARSRAVFVIPVEREAELGRGPWSRRRRLRIGARRVLIELRPEPGPLEVRELGEDDPAVRRWTRPDAWAP